MSDQNHEQRTEKATPLRREEARRRGHIPRSRDLMTAAALLGAFVTLKLSGADFLKAACEVSQRHLSGLAADAGAFSVERLAELAVVSGVNLLSTLLVLGAVTLAVAVAAVGLGGGFALRFATAGPDLGRLNPFTGARPLVGLRGLGRGGFALAKVVLAGSVLAIAIAPLASLTGPFVPARGGLGAAWAGLWSECIRWGMLLSFLLLGLGLLEYLFQRWLYEREIRMTRVEVLEETLRLEGRPELKRRRQRFRIEQISASKQRREEG